MSIAIGDSLPLALGVALSPLPVAAMLIVLLTERGRSNAAALFVGWVVGLVAVGLAVFWMPGLETPQGEPTQRAGLLRVVLGGLLLALALRQWHHRPDPSETIQAPGFVQRLDRMRIGAALSFGVALAALNPKNLGLTAAAAATIDTQGLDPIDQAIAFAIFTTLASSSILAPLAAHLVLGDRAARSFDRWKDWLLRNNPLILAVLLLVFGILILMRGIAILAA